MLGRWVVEEGWKRAWTVVMARVNEIEFEIWWFSDSCVEWLFISGSRVFLCIKARANERCMG